MHRGEGIYVEILIGSCVDEVWRLTQTPELHQLWDLRFTGIQYLPKNSEDEPQKFRYSTRIGFGLDIHGDGESTGTRENVTGLRTSALKFWSADPKSLITEGSGYWQYIPSGSNVRFLTWYDYRTRFGSLGRIIDRMLFRPLLGWATAWSFDRLRLWSERGIPPQVSMRMAVIHACARLGVAFIWLWQGLFPKLFFPSVDERLMLAAAGLSVTLLPLLGVAEIIFATITLVFWRWRQWFLWNALLMLAALIAVAFASPSYLVAAFNPVTLNVATILLSLVGYIASAELPTASRCQRQPPREEP
ncbi:MAG TPA: DoxX-like family protein [Candidatus Angelobacter sp.]|nr:DoxX-like family protein [Candidatus Angelobacter sp.]